MSGAFYHEKKQKKNSNSDDVKMRRFLKKCDILVLKKNLASSGPCKRCLSFLKKCGVRRVYYSVGQDRIRMEKVNEMVSNHISSRYRKPWSLQNGEDEKENENKILTTSTNKNRCVIA